MKVLILGAGQVGLGIAKYLKEQDTDVTIIEKSPEVALNIRNSSNLNVIIGNAMSAEVLKNANAENAGQVIATMSTDEENIVACKLAGSLFNVKTTIARIRSRDFLQGNVFELFLKDNFGIDILIQPEKEISDTVSGIAQIKGAFDVINLENVTVIGLKCLENTEVLNTTFKHFQGITNLDLFVLTITRDGQTFFPTSKDILLPEDEIYIATTPQNVENVLNLFGYPQSEKQNILIIGGGNIGTFILKTIITQKPNYNVILMERSVEKAQVIAQKYPNVTVIHGDALNRELLQEMAADADTAIVSTNSDKVNVLSSLFLKQFDVSRIITLAKTHNYDSLLPINSGCSVINPSSITIQTILHKSHKGKVTSVTSLKNRTAYIVEARVTESCAHIGNDIGAIRIKNQIIPIFVVRDGVAIFAKKDVTLGLNDNVVMLIAKNNLKKVEKMFSNYLFSTKSENVLFSDDRDIDKLIDEEDDEELL